MMDDATQGSVFESSFWSSFWSGTEIRHRLDTDLQASSSSSSNTICSDMPRNSKFKICQLNESVYELHRPTGTPSMQVVFFHGLQFEDYTVAHLSTWESRDGSQLWPQTWLVEEFPGAHVLCVSYDAQVVNGGGNLDLYLIAENLTSDLLMENIGQDPRCPVVLVGHCFGGLVIKRICLYMHERSNAGRSCRRENPVQFLQNVKGIFYYSTPHNGISSEIAKHFVKGPLLEFVEVLSTSAGRLTNEFNALRDQNAWQIAGVGENLPTKLTRFLSVVVVREASAREGEIFNVVQGADHISVSKPYGKTSRSFYALTKHLRDIVDHSKVNFHEVQGLPDYPVGLEEPIREIEKCERLRLTVEVMGRYLRDHVNDIEIWKEIIARLHDQRPSASTLQSIDVLVSFNYTRGVQAPWKSVVQPPTDRGVFSESQGLRPGQTEKSSDGRFALTLQSGGNLVLMFGDRMLWNTSTSGKNSFDVFMQGDGNFVMYNSAGKAIWNTGTAGSNGTTFVIQNDGNLVIYTANRTPVWSSRTNGH